MTTKSFGEAFDSVFTEHETMTVTIPACVEHCGKHSMIVNISKTCPKCGGPRGEPYDGLSFDGSRRLYVSRWDNPCGHIDSYSDVRVEARSNGLNPGEAS